MVFNSLCRDIRSAGAAGHELVELRDDKLDMYLAGALEDVRRMLDAAGVAP
jgi:hypothetical protein